MDLKFYFKKQFEFQMGSIPFDEKEKLNYQSKELKRINYIENYNDLRNLDSYEEFEYINWENKLSEKIIQALNELSKYTKNKVVSLYLYLPNDEFELIKGTYLCTYSKLIKVTSSNWTMKHPSSRKPCFIIASQLDKLIIFEKNGLVRALKQSGVLEFELETNLDVSSEQVEREQALTNFNALSFDAGLNINEIFILGFINIEDN